MCQVVSQSPLIAKLELFACSNHIALHSQQRSLTYKELILLSQQLAQVLQRIYQKEQQAYLVCFVDNSIETVILFVACLYAGITYVPLDKNLPWKRVEALLAMLASHYIVTNVELPKSIEATLGDKLLRLHTIMSAIRPLTSEIQRWSSETFCVFFTSGTTGEPKGVMISEQNILSTFTDTNYLSIDDHDRLLLMSNLSFDASLFEIWAALLNGATLVCEPTVTQDFFSDNHSALKEYGITQAILTTALFQGIVQHSPQSLSGLKTLFVGGEAILAKDCQRFFATLGAQAPQLVLLYGPTECTFASMYHVLDEASMLEEIIMPIGRPTQGTYFSILPDDPSVPNIGELLLGGAGVCLGYFNQKKLTIQSSKGQDLLHWYHTSDRVHQHSDGIVHFLGRYDRQIKLRGFRIDLNEIESTLNACQGIRQAIVEVIGSQHSHDRYLHAFCCLAPDGILEKVRAEIETTLPSYMCPVQYTILDSFVFTSYGKIDRKSCVDSIEKKETHETVCTSRIHYALHKLWQDVLPSCHLNKESDFFHVGGNSILAMALMHRINQRFSRGYNLGWLITHPTMQMQIDVLEKELPVRYEACVSFRDKQDGPTCCFIHPGFLGAESYLRLAQILPGNINFFSLDSYNLYHTSMKKTVKSLVSYYAKVIQNNFDCRMLYLGGWSFGAELAYEVSEKLVKYYDIKLILIDPDPPGQSEKTMLDIEYLDKTTPEFMKADLHRFTPEQLTHFEKHIVNEQTLVANYQPQHVSSLKTLVLYPSETLGHVDLEQAWSSFLLHAKYQRITGNHFDMMQGASLESIVKAMVDFIHT